MLALCIRLRRKKIPTRKAPEDENPADFLRCLLHKIKDKMPSQDHRARFGMIFAHTVHFSLLHVLFKGRASEIPIPFLEIIGMETGG